MFHMNTNEMEFCRDNWTLYSSSLKWGLTITYWSFEAVLGSSGWIHMCL